MSTKRVLAFTGIRSDYDLMSALFRQINEAKDLELGLIVAGTHLSEQYGYTVKHIEKDGLPILARIESLIDADSKTARIKSASILMQCCLHTVATFAPDIILYAGDREDVIVGALIGAYLGIPTLHFFGGDHAQDGNVDNPVRHAASKLSTAHFVAHPEHVLRLRRMGEPEGRIHFVGSPALDKFVEEPLLSKMDLLSQLESSDWEDYAIMIQHPILGQEDRAGADFETTLNALIQKGIQTFVGYPNTDAGSKQSLKVIEKYKTNSNFKFFKNLNRTVFVNLMRHALFMVGNSSAGLLEAPLIPLAAINVGLRQTGRIKAGNVVFCESTFSSIISAIDKVRSAQFQTSLAQIQSPYGDGHSVKKCLKVIRSTDFYKQLRKTEDPICL